MAIIGLMFLAGAVGTLTSEPWGWLVFGAGLIGFKVFDSIHAGINERKRLLWGEPPSKD